MQVLEEIIPGNNAKQGAAPTTNVFKIQNF